jgi:protein-disulfide isomerase
MLLVLLMAACGPATGSQTPALFDEADAEAEDTGDAAEETETGSESDNPGKEIGNNDAEDSKPVAAAGASSTDANGIPVGFTKEGRPYRGSLDAPIVMEEFSDFQCPFCARFSAQTLPALLENQIAAGELLQIYYDFPLESLHPQAFAAANAARCAGDQGAAVYWEMHDLLYERMDQWDQGDPNPVFAGFAEELNLEMEAFNNCVNEMAHGELVEADIETATSRGIRSTPSFFLNGQPLIGAQPLAAFDDAIAAIQGGETIAAIQEPSEPKSPLRPPPVKPTPVALDMETYAAAMGDPGAPVTIVEFTDYECPFCQRYSNDTMPTLISEKIDSGEVYYILKDLPLESIHPNARAAAVAARCAGEQDAYWEMHDALFEAQGEWGGGSARAQEVFVTLAAGLELDGEAFSECINDHRYMQAIQSNLDEARSLGADGTPYFFINGFPLSGAQPYEIFDYGISLAKEGKLADAYVPPEPEINEASALGDPDAPVTIIEFTDYQCPFCSRYFTETFGQIKEKYVDTGQVYYVIKDFPLTNIHPQAVRAAEAAKCAAEQDAFQAMHDILFEQQGAWSGNGNADALFEQFADEIGIENGQFIECMESKRMEPLILAELEEGARLGVNGTPAFVINGHLMSGAQPYPVFEDAIEQFLEEG